MRCGMTYMKPEMAFDLSHITRSDTCLQKNGVSDINFPLDKMLTFKYR